MCAIPTDHPYIAHDPKIAHGEPIIRGTDVRVCSLVEYWQWGLTPPIIREFFPDLNLMQIYNAISYYEEHKDEINRLIAANRQSATR